MVQSQEIWKVAKTVKIMIVCFLFRPQRKNSQKQEAEKGNQTSSQRAAKVII